MPHWPWHVVGTCFELYLKQHKLLLNQQVPSLLSKPRLLTIFSLWQMINKAYYSNFTYHISKSWILKITSGTPQAVQLLRLCTSMQGAWVQSLIWELRSRTALPKKKKKSHICYSINTMTVCEWDYQTGHRNSPCKTLRESHFTSLWPLLTRN